MIMSIKKLMLAFFLFSSVLLAAGSAYAASLYFPHVDTNLPWQTEIAIINTGDQTVTGTLKGMSDAGQLVETKAVTLSARGRIQIPVAGEFTNHTDIGYIIFDTDSDAVQGYTKVYQEGIYRAAIPAVKEINTSDIYISHIDSSALWWTGVSLVNTTAQAKELTITFNNGQSVPYTLNANAHGVFTIASLFNNQPQPNIQSAVITNASGIIGLELFGSKGGTTQMDGLLLTDNTASTIYYPHVDNNAWWTGIVAYNPSESACTVTITPYSAQGDPLTPKTISIAGKGKYVGVVADLGLPAQTAWFRIDSTSPLSGFELFATTDGSQLAAYAGAGGTSAKNGVFAKIEKNGGWTGIAFVNTEENAASVTLTAYNDNGTVAATQVLPVGEHAKVVNLAKTIFTQDISSASYIAYSSDKNVIGFQLNGTSDGMMLDGLPTLAIYNNDAAVAGIQIDMWQGGFAVSDQGLAVEILSGSWPKTVEVIFDEPEPAEDPGPEAVAVSDIYSIRLKGFEQGETTIPFRVTLPVSTANIKEDSIETNTFYVETYNEDTAQWEYAEVMAEYDEATSSISFWTDHFSKYRAIYISFDSSLNLAKYLYRTDRFHIWYYAPREFGQSYASRYSIVPNSEWNDKGSGTEYTSEAPKYIQDLGKALEAALTYHTRKIVTPKNEYLFYDPTQADPNNKTPLEVNVTKLEDTGDTAFGGTIRIDAKLKDYTLMKAVAAHELMHVLQDQHYTIYGAFSNKWFIEATAELWGTRAAEYTAEELKSYFSGKELFLKVSMDASEKDSYYAVGDFLYWLEKKMGGAIAAAVVERDAFWDVNGLNEVLKEWGSGLSEEFKQYVLESTVGNHDRRVENIREPVRLSSGNYLYKKLHFKQPHLSAKHVIVTSTDLIYDGLLVATSGRDYPHELPLDTYSYTRTTLPVDDIENTLETVADNKQPLVVKHFGKPAIAGVQHSVFHQVIINPLVADNVVGSEYFFEYYMLVPPKVETPDFGTVRWTFPDASKYGYADFPIKGFNVYSDGMKLNSETISASNRTCTDNRISPSSKVQVTVVDKFGNEWPEDEEQDLPPNWEMNIFLAFTGSGTDSLEWFQALILDWVPVTVQSDGSVTYDYSWRRDDSEHRIWGTGTFKDNKLEVKGSWKSVYDVEAEHLEAQGQFTLAGGFTKWGSELYFSSDPEKSSAIAEKVVKTTHYHNNVGVVETHVYTWNNVRPADEPAVQDFRIKN